MSFDEGVFDPQIFGANTVESCLFDGAIFDSAVFDTCEVEGSGIPRIEHHGASGSPRLRRRKVRRHSDNIENQVSLPETEFAVVDITPRESVEDDDLIILAITKVLH